MAILYYSRNPNPRLALAVARHLNAPVKFEWVSRWNQNLQTLAAWADPFEGLNTPALPPIVSNEE